MKRIIPILACIAVLLPGCKDEEPKRQVFKFTINSDYANAAPESWVVVKDNETGELVDAKSVKPGETISVESNKKLSGGLTVSFLKVDPGLFAHVDIYAGIAVGSEWTLYVPHYNPTNPGDIPGTYSLKINGVPSVYGFAVSDKFGPTNSTAPSFAGGALSGKFNIHTGDARQFISIDTGVGNPKYSTVENMQPNDNLTLNYSAFKDFDKVAKLTFPKGLAVATVWGFEGPPNTFLSYVLYNNISDGAFTTDRTELSLGFLNSFPNYGIDLSVTGFSYRSVGPPPSAIEYLDDEGFTIASETITDYSISTSRQYSYRNARYSYFELGTSYELFYYATAGETIQREPLTKELMDKYSFNLAEFNYQGTSIYFGQSYDEFVKTIFDPGYDLTTPYIVSTVFTR